MRLLLVIATAAAAAGAPAAPADLVARYARGERGTLEALGRLSEKGLRAELLYIRKLAVSRRRTAADDAHLERYPFVASVLAHTELAQRAHEAGEREALALYAELARGYLDAGGERTADLAPPWYLLFTLRHLERLELPEALRFAEEGTRTLPGDAHLWLAAGTVSQAIARFVRDQPEQTSTLAEQLRERLRTTADHRARSPPRAASWSTSPTARTPRAGWARNRSRPGWPPRGSSST